MNGNQKFYLSNLNIKILLAFITISILKIKKISENFSVQSKETLKTNIEYLKKDIKNMQNSINDGFSTRCDKEKSCNNIHSECSNKLPNLICTDLEDYSCSFAKKGVFIEASYFYPVLGFNLNKNYNENQNINQLEKKQILTLEQKEQNKYNQEISCALSENIINENLQNISKNYIFATYQYITSYNGIRLNFPGRTICEKENRENKIRESSYCLAAMGARNIFLIIDISQTIKNNKNAIDDTLFKIAQIYDTLNFIDNLYITLFDKKTYSFYNDNFFNIENFTKKQLQDNIKEYLNSNKNNTNTTINDSRNINEALDKIYKKLDFLENDNNENDLKKYANNHIFLFTESFNVTSSSEQLVTNYNEAIRIKNLIVFNKIIKPFYFIIGVGKFSRYGLDYIKEISCEMKGLYFVDNPLDEFVEINKNLILSDYCKYFSLNNQNDEIIFYGPRLNDFQQDKAYTALASVYSDMNLIDLNSSTNLGKLNFLAFVYGVDLNIKKISKEFNIDNDRDNNDFNELVKNSLKNFQIKIKNNQKNIYNNVCLISLLRNDKKICKNFNSCNLNNYNFIISHEECTNNKIFYNDNKIFIRKIGLENIDIENEKFATCCSKTSIEIIVIICIGVFASLIFIVFLIIYLRKKKFFFRRKDSPEDNSNNFNSDDNQKREIGEINDQASKKNEEEKVYTKTESNNKFEKMNGTENANNTNVNINRIIIADDDNFNSNANIKDYVNENEVNVIIEENKENRYNNKYNHN
jgi:hypothetical protein